MIKRNYLGSLPCVTIDRQKLQHNIQTISQILADRQVLAHFSTTGIAAYEPMIELMARSGVHNFADSSLDNLAVARPYADSLLLDRLPMISEVSRLVQEVDMSVNSELETIFAISDAAVVEGKRHGVILLLELGDLSDGVLADDLFDTVHQILNLRGVELKGIRCHLNSFSGTLATLDNLSRFAQLVTGLEERFEIQLDYVSAGGSATIPLLDDEEFPVKINHVVIGQAWLFGRESASQHRIGNLHQDVFSLLAEVVENKRKDSYPSGNLGFNYAGETLTFEDVGVIRRVILALGAQDVNLANLPTKEKGIDYIGSNLDYAIYNISKYNRKLEIGDAVEFTPDYVALNRLFNSPRINKVID